MTYVRTALSFADRVTSGLQGKQITRLQPLPGAAESCVSRMRMLSGCTLCPARLLSAWLPLVLTPAPGSLPCPFLKLPGWLQAEPAEEGTGWEPLESELRQ